MNINQLAASNIKWLAKKQGKKLGDIEAAIGVTPGYFSRKISGNTISIPLELAYKASKILSVSMDEICTDLRLKELEEYATACGYKLVLIEEVVE